MGKGGRHICLDSGQLVHEIECLKRTLLFIARALVDAQSISDQIVDKLARGLAIGSLERRSRCHAMIRQDIQVILAGQNDSSKGIDLPNATIHSV